MKSSASKTIRNIIKTWYRKNRRNLPWRETSDPYKIWVSEIILQQTRVSQGTGHYLKFVTRFPDLKTLAAATEEEVLKTWQGMGYYTRARNMHKTALLLTNAHGGAFPCTPEELAKLPGIGSYTAAAIASIAFQYPVATIDANSMRIIARLYGIHQDIRSAGIKKKTETLAMELLDRENPGEFNQALMDFGSLQCTPGIPDCGSCPLNHYCEAHLTGMVNKIPLLRQKKRLRHRYFHYLVITDGTSVWLHKRTENDIWHSLYEFPLAEMPSGKRPDAGSWFKTTGIPHIQPEKISETYRHTLSHQLIHARFYEVTVPCGQKPKGNDLIPVPVKSLGSYPLPVLIARYLADSGIAHYRQKG